MCLDKLRGTNAETLRAFIRSQVLARPQLFHIRYFLWLVQAKKDQRAVVALSKILNIQPLDIMSFRFSDSKEAKTLFILGSGSSINELTTENFEEIGSEISVGINLWVAHDFVPDTYSFESTGLPLASGEEAQIRQMGVELQRKQVIDASPKILLLRPPSPSKESQFVQIPETLRTRSFLYGRANLAPTELGIAPNEIQKFVSRFISEPGPHHVLPDNGASVVRILFFALKKNFEQIVLVGVDLNTEPYFWYEKGWQLRRPELSRIFPRAVGIAHDTTETTNRPYNTRDLIAWISKSAELTGSSKIFVASPSSSLARFLPLYPWQS